VRRHRSLDLNIGAVVCGDGVLIIDTRASHVQAAEMVESLKDFTRLPVRWVINTHHHWDHTFGNQVFPEAALWGLERTAEAMRTQGEAMRAQVKAMAPDHADTLDQVVITPPRLTFATTATLTFGGTVVELRHLGRGHTDNDIVISLPERNALFAGDLIEEGAPPSFNDSFPLDWPETVTAGWNRVIGNDPAGLRAAVADALAMDLERARPDLFGDAAAAERIVSALERHHHRSEAALRPHNTPQPQEATAS